MNGQTGTAGLFAHTDTGVAPDRIELEFVRRDMTVSGFIALIRQRRREVGLVEGPGFDPNYFVTPLGPNRHTATSYFKDAEGWKERTIDILLGETSTARTSLQNWVRDVWHSEPLFPRAVHPPGERQLPPRDSQVQAQRGERHPWDWLLLLP